TSFFEAFRIADDILRQGVQGISDIITITGIINRDFADIKTIMEGMGYAVMGTATASGEDRAIQATNRAISSPLLEDASINGAQGILLNITGSSKLTLHEVHSASSIIQQSAADNANIIFGAVLDESMNDEVKVTVIATGVKSDKYGKPIRTGRTGITNSTRSIQETAKTIVQRREKLPVDAKPEELSPEITLDDLDVPAYLRRRKAESSEPAN
ncbi:MAG: cell division protein FtsZ, partial [Terriglobia bacterium]